MTIETVKEINKLMETPEQKPLTKHLKAAVNAIQKQIEKYQAQAYRQRQKAKDAEYAADVLDEMVKALSEQISKLKGE